MKKFVMGLSIFLFLSIMVPIVRAPWEPDWENYAMRYVDDTGETIPMEDMTVCYMTHDGNHLYFKAEFLGAGDCELFLYLDMDQSQDTGKTGSDDVYAGLNLHDLGADYRIYIYGTCGDLFRWVSDSSWVHVGPLDGVINGDAYYAGMASLASLGDPDFPIDILFVSTSAIDLTDWNPDAGHYAYPYELKYEPVGGEIIPYRTIIFVPSLIVLCLTVLTIGVGTNSRSKLLR